MNESAATCVRKNTPLERAMSEKIERSGKMPMRAESHEPSDVPTQDAWRVRLAMAREWRATVNKHGGDVTLMHLPELGIKGNTHFPFSDLNNVQIADQVSTFLAAKSLD
jgi:hypothetical protein